MNESDIERIRSVVSREDDRKDIDNVSAPLDENGQARRITLLCGWGGGVSHQYYFDALDRAGLLDKGEAPRTESGALLRLVGVVGNYQDSHYHLTFEDVNYPTSA